MKIHRLAKYFPILEGEEFDLLVEDIKKNGQKESIKIIGDEILDGVNRYRACKKLDIEPIYADCSDKDPLAYVISENIRRRHMTESQRAMLATEMLPEFEKEAKERELEGKRKGGLTTRPTDRAVRRQNWHAARDDAAHMFGVSGPIIQRAKRIKEKAPDKVDEIIKGKVTVGAIDEEIRRAEASKLAAEDRGKRVEKGIKEHPKIVKEYLDFLKTFDDKLGLAIEAAKRKLFSPESINIIKSRHECLRARMEELEEKINE
jgi:ParB-like chromosome segregation protein Spo0J